MFDLSGKVAIVTGSGQGNGVGMVRALATQGAAVAVVDLIPERAQTTSEALQRDGLTVIAMPFDVTDVAAVKAGVARIATELGSIDILVNNAGTLVQADPTKRATRKQFRETMPEDWRAFVDLNIYGSLNCIHSVLEEMCERRWGRIIQISSGAARQGQSYGVSLYGASKSGIEGFIRHLSQEVGPFGVTANAIALGRMGNAGDLVGSEPVLEQIPIGRFGSPDDAGAAVAFLSSDEAGYITGQTLAINGGRNTN